MAAALAGFMLFCTKSKSNLAGLSDIIVANNVKSAKIWLYEGSVEMA
jgi:hypothetical protein